MKNVKKIVLLIALMGTGLLMSCTTIEQSQVIEKSNKVKVVELLNSIESGDMAPVANINAENYTQHNLAVADGLAGFGAALQALNGTGEVRVVRAFEDGDYVFAHTEYEFFGPKAGFDIFRFEDGLIVEHWDNLQEIVTETASGRTMFDGSVEITDLDKTEENKELIKTFVNDVFLGANPDAQITDFISTESYAQHNPGVKDGLAGFGEAMAALAQAGTPMVYTQNHMILGEGNFVLVASEGQFLGNHVSFYDLFRIEDGKIVEHWDTIEEIPAESDWMNTNGKF